MSSTLLESLTHEREDVKPYPSADSRPHPESYDSGEECSFAHLARLCNLVELDLQTSIPPDNQLFVVDV